MVAIAAERDQVAGSVVGPVAVEVVHLEDDAQRMSRGTRGTAGLRRPDPSSDRADEGEFGTAYRIPSELSHASQPRSPSNTMRRMRRMKQDP